MTSIVNAPLKAILKWVVGVYEDVPGVSQGPGRQSWADHTAQIAADGAVADALQALQDNITDADTYQGTWNADTNSPAIPAAASGNRGWYYRVSTAGTTTINGISSWAVGDLIVSNGTVWQKVPNNSAVTSVNGQTGAVLLTTAPTATRGDSSQLYANTEFVQLAASDAVAVKIPTTERTFPPFAMMDADGNLADPPSSRLGYQHSFTLADCDAIGVWGDSYVDATYVLKDKAWVSVVSNFSAYRFVNMGRSGYDATEIYTMKHDGRLVIVPDVSWDYNHVRGSPWGARRVRYAILKTWTNDLVSHGAAGWLQNVEKLIDLWRANGVQPVLLAEHRAGSPVDTTNYQAVVYGNLARKRECDLIPEPFQLGKELQLLNGPFTDGGHPGTRTGMVYAAPVLKWLERIPKPRRSIKIYRLRNGTVVSDLNDLVFNDAPGLVALFKEISLSHVAITVQPEHYEERNKYFFNGTAGPAGAPNALNIADEYNGVRDGGAIALADYGLLRVALPGGSRSLRGVAIEMFTDATAVYVLDRFGRNTADTDNLTGTWTAVAYQNGAVRLSQSMLARCMYDNELYLLLYKVGGVSLARPEIHYSGLESVPEPRLVRRYDVAGSELLSTMSAASLTGWTTSGSPSVVSPFDLAFGGPRAPGLSTTITAVTEVTSSNKIGQATSVTASREIATVFRVRVMARYWPKPFLNNSLSGYGFPADEVIDTSLGNIYPDNSLITEDTYDFRRLKLESLFSAGASTSFTTYEAQEKVVGLYWTLVDFYVSTISSVLPGTFNWRLSGPDGAVQVAWVSVREVIEHEHRI